MKPDMSLQSLEARTLSAELRGDEQAWRQLHASYYDDAESNWSEVMPTACAMAAARRFGQTDLRLITTFVRKFLARHPHSGFSAADIEAVLRGLLGEERLLTSVNAAAAGEIMYAMLFALIDELDLSDEQADGLLAVAERQVRADYAAVDVPPGGPPDAPVLSDIMHRRTRQPYLDGDAVPPPRLDDTSTSNRGPGRLFGGGGPPRSRRHSRKNKALPSTLAGRVITASMLRHSEERERWMAILRPLRTDDSTVLTRAAFTVAVRRHFRPDVDLREISDLVAAAREAFVPDLDLMATEFMIRAALGEDVPDPGLGEFDEVVARMLVLTGLSDWWNRDERAVNEVIVQAEADVLEAGGSLVPADS